MVTREQLREIMGTRPFRPFLVVTAGGDEFQVRDPGNASCSVKGDEMVVYDDRGMHVLDMRDADIRRAGPEAAAKTSDEGDPIHATMTPEERRQIDQFQAWCKANGYTSGDPVHIPSPLEKIAGEILAVLRSIDAKLDRPAGG